MYINDSVYIYICRYIVSCYIHNDIYIYIDTYTVLSCRVSVLQSFQQPPGPWAPWHQRTFLMPRLAVAAIVWETLAAINLP